MTAAICDIFTPQYSQPEMTPEQFLKRAEMRERGWDYKKITGGHDVVMTKGEPIQFMAFIEPDGVVKTYNYME
jgi:hypothetical protein